MIDTKQAKDWIKKTFPLTAIGFEEGRCVNLNDVAYICEKYHQYKLEESRESWKTIPRDDSKN